MLFFQEDNAEAEEQLVQRLAAFAAYQQLQQGNVCNAMAIAAQYCPAVLEVGGIADCLIIQSWPERACALQLYTIDCCIWRHPQLTRMRMLVHQQDLCTLLLLSLLLQDQRLAFRLKRQQFIELLRQETAEGDSAALGEYDTNRPILHYTSSPQQLQDRYPCNCMQQAIPQQSPFSF